jgi:hypothetical protein
VASSRDVGVLSLVGCARRGSGLTMTGGGRDGRVRVTPGATQQGSVWPDCHCRDHQKCNLKHVILGPGSGKKDANEILLGTVKW